MAALNRRVTLAFVAVLTPVLVTMALASSDIPEKWKQASEAFAMVNAKMHRDMAVDLTGDPDLVFVRGMIPHHQGAIEAAKIVLMYGQDPEVRAVAEKIIATQEEEIGWMKEWLAKRGEE